MTLVDWAQLSLKPKRLERPSVWLRTAVSAPWDAACQIVLAEFRRAGCLQFAPVTSDATRPRLVLSWRSPFVSPAPALLP
jgi:hypothetical protein